MILREIDVLHAKDIYDFIRKTPSENGFENPYYGMGFDDFVFRAIPERKDCAQGKDLPEGYMPDHWLFLFDAGKVIGLFKVRPRLNDFLASGPGHIGYAILPSERGKGYGKEGLRLCLQWLFDSPDFQDEEVYFQIRKDNPASKKIVLANGGYCHHVDEEHDYLRIRRDGLRLSDFPLAEFTNEPGFITPKEGKEMAGKLLVTFFPEVVEEMVRSGRAELALTLKGENDMPVYRIVGTDVFLVLGIIGAPATGGFMEEMFAKGIRKVLFIGGAGSLVPSPLGKPLLVSSAIRDEGFSFHYMRPSRYVEADAGMLEELAAFLKEKGVSYDKGRAWTTDAFYREMPEKIRRRIQEGAKMVEMEQAGLIALCRFRNVPYGAILYSGDDLSGSEYSTREWKRSESRRHLVELAIEYLSHERH